MYRLMQKIDSRIQQFHCKQRPQSCGMPLPPVVLLHAVLVGLLAAARKMSNGPTKKVT